MATLSKTNLQTVCKTLSLSTSGTKVDLHNRIRSVFCEGIPVPKKPTLRSLVRVNDPRAHAIAKDIEEMLDDDSEIPSIVKTLQNLHKVTINKIDVQVFAEIIDAVKKRDYLYIEENLPAWGKQANHGLALAKAYLPKDVHLNSIEP